jgi:dTDP-4-amino-4,6-dideoxygalactose transaminase
MIRDHGSERRYYHDRVVLNPRLDEIQTVMLRAKLPHLVEWNEQRRSHASRYDEWLKGTPVVAPVAGPGNQHVYQWWLVL